MALRFNGLLSGSIVAKDGELGVIKDVLFDDQSWRVRYVVADTSKWLRGQTVLLVPACFSAQGVTPELNLRVDLTMEQVKNAPTLNTQQDLSKQHEAALHEYYGWIPYWTSPLSPISYPYPDAELALSGLVDETTNHWKDFLHERNTKLDTHVKSCQELIGYKIRTKEQAEFGEVSDILIDPQEWLLIDLVLNTNRWLPGGKEFVCSPMFVRDIDLAKTLLIVNQDKETLLESPEFKLESYGSAYRKALVKHYCDRSLQSRPPVLTRDQVTGLDRPY